mmetsp:Transcript_31513/g.89448  ORF Transcript_31513/g.89448 Transcript_31513/m.89448 type:complete len:567 (+) Transcript_31513:182-1882(+)
MSEAAGTGRSGGGAALPDWVHRVSTTISKPISQVGGAVRQAMGRGTNGREGAQDTEAPLLSAEGDELQERPRRGSQNQMVLSGWQLCLLVGIIVAMGLLLFVVITHGKPQPPDPSKGSPDVSLTVECHNLTVKQLHDPAFMAQLEEDAAAGIGESTGMNVDVAASEVVENEQTWLGAQALSAPKATQVQLTVTLPPGEDDAADKLGEQLASGEMDSTAFLGKKFIREYGIMQVERPSVKVHHRSKPGSPTPAPTAAPTPEPTNSPTTEPTSMPTPTPTKRDPPFFLLSFSAVSCSLEGPYILSCTSQCQVAVVVASSCMGTGVGDEREREFANIDRPDGCMAVQRAQAPLSSDHARCPDPPCSSFASHFQCSFVLLWPSAYSLLCPMPAQLSRAPSPALHPQRRQVPLPHQCLRWRLHLHQPQLPRLRLVPQPKPRLLSLQQYQPQLRHLLLLPQPPLQHQLHRRPPQWHLQFPLPPQHLRLRQPRLLPPLHAQLVCTMPSAGALMWAHTTSATGRTRQWQRFRAQCLGTWAGHATILAGSMLSRRRSCWLSFQDATRPMRESSLM